MLNTVYSEFAFFSDIILVGNDASDLPSCDDEEFNKRRRDAILPYHPIAPACGTACDEHC